MPKLAVLLAWLTSVGWFFFLYPNETGMTLAVLAIPVILSFEGWLGNERERDAGIAMVLFSALVFFLSGWIWLSYFAQCDSVSYKQKGRGLRPSPATPPK